MHQEVTAKRRGSEIINTARTIGDIAQNNHFGASFRLQKIGDGRGEEEQALGELEGDALGLLVLDALDGLGELEVVVAWEAQLLLLLLVVGHCLDLWCLLSVVPSFLS